MTTVPPEPSVFERLARWCMTHPRQTMLAWGIALVAAIAVGRAVGTREISSLRLPGTESQRAYDVADFATQLAALIGLGVGSTMR